MPTGERVLTQTLKPYKSFTMNMEKIKQESLEMFMLKRKILKELEQMDENEDFIMQIGLAGKEKNE